MTVANGVTLGFHLSYHYHHCNISEEAPVEAETVGGTGTGVKTR